KFAILRLDPVPRYAPAKSLQADIAAQIDVNPPMLVMAYQLIFIERAMPAAGLGHKRVLDTGRPNKIAGSLFIRACIARSKFIHAARSVFFRLSGRLLRLQYYF